MVKAWELVNAEKNNVLSFVGWMQPCGGDGDNEEWLSFKKLEYHRAVMYTAFTSFILSTQTFSSNIANTVSFRKRV